jgi:hypothetical protein
VWIDGARKEVGGRVVESIRALEPRRVALQGGNPHALARDVAKWLAAGWKLLSLSRFAVDPHTPFVEAVAVLASPDDRPPVTLALPILLLSPLFSVAAVAGEATPVMVSAFQPRNEASAALAALIEGFVAQKLQDHDDLRVLRVDDAPDFEDYSARIYMDSCAPGEIVGCTFVIADRGGAAWAVTGAVQELVKGTRVDVDIVDVRNSRVAVSFRSDLEPGRDEEFAEGVARVLIAAIAGEVGREEDIRPDNEEVEANPEDDKAVAAELDALSKELGGFSTTLRQAGKVHKPKELTEEDILAKEEQEGSKPWERLHMSSAEYLRYKNSGMNLPTWRQRQLGRKFQILLRAGAGFINGPVNGTYYGRSALDATTLTPVDVYTAQSVESGSSGVGVVGVGFGILPMLDVAVEGGATGGEFEYFVQQETVDQVNTAPTPVTDQNANFFVSGKATVGLFPTWNLRPTFGAGATWFRGSGIADHLSNLPDEMAIFPAADLWMVQVFGGGEARLNDHLDFTLQIPVNFLIGGDRVQSERNTTVAALEGINEPGGAAAIGVSVIAGLQVRLFGAKAQSGGILDETDEM